ncbi:MAG: glycosyltransferase family 2 protein [Alphaproteobacteria bacterium]|nr:glycosyltransferase family 2 protein [Alphaproteobacteria bacterium]
MTTLAAIIPTHNGRAFIARALDSALAQDAPADEIVVVDDASTDGTADLVAERYPTVRLVRLPRNVGSGAARNAGVAASTGELIAFLDHDDAWHPGYLAAQRALFAGAPKAILGRTGLTVIDDRRGIQSTIGVTPVADRDETIRKLLCGQNPIVTLSVVAVRRPAFEQVGGFDPNLRVLNDRDLYLKLIRSGGFTGTAQALVTKYMHGDNLLFEKGGATWLAEHLAILDHFFADPAHDRFRPLEAEARRQAQARVEQALKSQRAQP